ncbi:putative GroES-like protein [Seiridium cardinale]
MPSQSQVAWVPGGITQVGVVLYTRPGPEQIVVKNGAVAINLFDWVLEYQAATIASHPQCPMIIGVDVAVTVFEVGPDVTRFRVGDRVAGNAISVAQESNNSRVGSCAIQLAVSACYEVLWTSFPNNFAYVKGLGATHVFDYSETLVADLVRAPEGRELHGAFTVGADADQACVSFMKESLSKKQFCSPGNLSR